MLGQAQQEGNSNSETAVAFLKQLRGRPGKRLNVIWDNAPAPLRQAQEWGGDAGIPHDTWAEPEAGEPRVKHGAGSAGLQPGLQR